MMFTAMVISMLLWLNQVEGFARMQIVRKTYPYSKRYYEEALKRLPIRSSKNDTVRPRLPLKEEIWKQLYEEELAEAIKAEEEEENESSAEFQEPVLPPTKHFPHSKIPYIRSFNQKPGSDANLDYELRKSAHFTVVKDHPLRFANVGGYKSVKDELRQTLDLLQNVTKYAKYNVRIPKGMIFEGPPGNGKTMMAKALAGEANCGFIAVSGSDFQEKYIGVGSSRIREIFELAKKNEPCIIFIDEMEAVGRSRSTDTDSSSSERDNTLNALLVELDGFKNRTGIFVVGATNRIDLLDSALLRPGRIDKKIYIGYPDTATRKEVLDIHIKGKPHVYKTNELVHELVDLTNGFSCAQIENLLNEAMLLALRQNQTRFSMNHIDAIYNTILSGSHGTTSEHEYTESMVERIAVHEMGHAILGLLAEHHPKLKKVVLNLASPKAPGYTAFDRESSRIYVKESLFEHLIILLGGRIAEELTYNCSITTGAVADFDEAMKLAESMIVHYGMGENIMYPQNSEKYKAMIDDQISEILHYAYFLGKLALSNCKPFLLMAAKTLEKKQKITNTELSALMKKHVSELSTLREIISSY